MAVSPVDLRNALVQSFNLGELNTLCFELGIVYENLGGQGLEAKALSLVQYARRHGLYDQLAATVQKKRPHLDFGYPPDAGAGSTSAANPAQPAGQTGNTYNFFGPVSGSAVGESANLRADNIAGRDIHITNSEPQDRAEFARQLVHLEALLKQAIANGEIADPRDAATAVEDIQDAIEEVKHDEPRGSRLSRRLEDVKEIIETASQTGAAALKAVPIVSGLIKVVATLF